MTDKKKQHSKTEKPEMEMHDMEAPEMEMPMPEEMCPIMHGCPMICPMMCPMMHNAEWPGMEDMRSSDWYDDDSDYISEESDEYPVYWKHKKKHKFLPYQFYWPSFYPVKPYKKKHKKW